MFCIYEMLSSEKKCAMFSGAIVAKWHCYTLENIHFRYSKSLSSTQYSVEVKQALIYIYFNNVVSGSKAIFFLTDYILIVNSWG